MGDNGKIKLECPNCRTTLDISQWNENMKDSISIGRADELIPLDIDAEGWKTFRREHSGVVDCPECGEVCVLDDMEAF